MCKTKHFKRKYLALPQAKSVQFVYSGKFVLFEVDPLKSMRKLSNTKFIRCFFKKYNTTGTYGTLRYMKRNNESIKEHWSLVNSSKLQFTLIKKENLKCQSKLQWCSMFFSRTFHFLPFNLNLYSVYISLTWIFFPGKVIMLYIFHMNEILPSSTSC